MRRNRNFFFATICCLLAAAGATGGPATAQTSFGPEELIQAGGVDIDVPGFSVPSLARWDGDDLPDLVIGEGGFGLDDGKVRVYLNTGTLENPVFGDFQYAQANGSDLALPSGG